MMHPRVQGLGWGGAARLTAMPGDALRAGMLWCLSEVTALCTCWLRCDCCPAVVLALRVVRACAYMLAAAPCLGRASHGPKVACMCTSFSSVRGACWRLLLAKAAPDQEGYQLAASSCINALHARALRPSLNPEPIPETNTLISK